MEEVNTGRRGPRTLAPGAWTGAATAAMALVVVVLAVRIGQIALELVTEPGVWGR